MFTHIVISAAIAILSVMIGRAFWEAFGRSDADSAKKRLSEVDSHSGVAAASAPVRRGGG